METTMISRTARRYISIVCGLTVLLLLSSISTSWAKPNTKSTLERTWHTSILSPAGAAFQAVAFKGEYAAKTAGMVEQATPTVGVGLLRAPKALRPANRSTFAAYDVVLEWSPIKQKLTANEYYIITVFFKHDGARWNDYAYTQTTRWSVAEHDYLLDLSDDGLFEWSVQLIRATGKDPLGIPTGKAVSAPSAPQTFLWRLPSIDDSRDIRPTKPTPAPTPTDDCVPYCAGLAEPAELSAVLPLALWLAASLTVGLVATAGRERRKPK
jgi:hypothetical protein